MLLDGYKYLYAAGENTEKLQRFAIEIDDSYNFIAELTEFDIQYRYAATGEPPDDNDFDLTNEESFSPANSNPLGDIALPDNAFSPEVSPSETSVPSDVVTPTGAAPSIATVPAQAPELPQKKQSNIYSYTGLYMLPLPKPIKGVEELGVDIKVKDENTLEYSSFLVLVGGRKQFIDHAEDTTWNDPQFTSPVKYQYHIWKKAFEQVKDMYHMKDEEQERDGTAPHSVTTSISTQNATTDVTSRIKGSTVHTSFNTFETDTNKAVISNEYLPRLTLNDIQATYNLTIDSKEALDTYNRMRFKDTINKRVIDAVPTYVLVHEGMDGLQLREIYMAQLGRGTRFKVKIVSSNLINGQWVKDPESIAENTYPDAATARAVVKSIASNSKGTPPGLSKSKIMNSITQKLNNALPKTNWFEKQKKRKEDTKLRKLMERSQQKRKKRQDMERLRDEANDRADQDVGN